ncbi:type II secretion system protein K [Brevundimonas denitrificans]|uniref:Type II secretion system protein K n=1 Tax=Brevundimonas denitrificans TaxID=1443434 RepID=A0ABQ6BL45_9CAUL|nr:type II secretion system minor pseudopilin GspK [Brevundimonas denitrificans]GLS02631.1 type II secretion system protein K [Brevundimonas denitrificans]
MKAGPRRDREGMALLAVLLLVAVMAVVAVAVLDDVRFSVRRTTNAETGAQAQWYADGAETLARQRIARLTALDPNRTSTTPAWNGRAVTLPIDGGTLTATVRDGQACFNLNSVVTWTGDRLAARPVGEAQLMALGRAVGVDPLRMRTITDSLIDWIDTDTTARPLGAEDSVYAALAEPYRTGGVLLAEVSEMRTVRGVDKDAYDRLRPHLCALPTDRSPINVNTLAQADAPLLVMLTGGSLSLPAARTVIAARPAGGWPDPAGFWSQPALTSLQLDLAARDQVTVRTDYFAVRIDVDHGGVRAVRTALIESRPGGEARTVIRRWTLED